MSRQEMKGNMRDKPLAPQSMEAERAVLGSILLNANLYREAARHLKPEDFFLESHRKIFRAMELVAERIGSGSIDMVTLCDALGKVASVEEAGGKSYLASLVDGLPRYSNLDHYAGIVREKAKARLVIAACERATKAAFGGEDADAVIKGLSGHLSKLRTIGTDVQLEPVGDPDWVVEMTEEMGERDSGNFSRADGTFIDAPWPSLKSLGLFEKGHLAVIGARPSVGKSMFCNNLAVNLAMKGYRGSIFSKEDRAPAIRRRMLSMISGIPSGTIKRGRFTAEELAQFHGALRTMESIPLQVTNSVGFDSRTMLAMAQAEYEERGLDFVVIDHLQKFVDEGDNRVQLMGQITHALAEFAKEQGVLVILASQLSREAVRKDPRVKSHPAPQLSDLRESGEIEQDADEVLFLHRESYYDEQTRGDMGLTEIILAKHRDGPTGWRQLWFDGTNQEVREP